MDLITSDQVIHRIKFYFDGGALKYLSASQLAAAELGVRTTAKNRYDSQTLNLHSAGMACEEFIKTIPPYPASFDGRGIVMCAGGVRYFTNAWVCINRLRKAGCRLPIEVWYLDESEMDQEMSNLLAPLGVRTVNAREVKRKHPARIDAGWPLKAYALLHSRFREVLFLDADNVAVVNPEFLFGTAEYQATGAIFWPDYERGKNMKAFPIWRSCGLRQPNEPEFETGQIVVDKQRCWEALCLALWFNENSNFYYQYLYGDKDTFHIAFRKMKTRYSLVPKAIHTLDGTMCQHDFVGRRIFQHRNTDKWDLLLRNRMVKGFQFEDECWQHVKRLRGLWDGRMKNALNGESTMFRRSLSKRKPTIQLVMISLVERPDFRDRTLESLSRTKWEALIDVHVENGETDDGGRRYLRGAYTALKSCLRRKTDYVLLLKDALEINEHLWHNLLSWQPFSARTVKIGSLYNPNVSELACDARTNTRVVSASAAMGNEALLIAREGVECLLRRWHRFERLQNFDLRHAAKCLATPVYYHAPSLVQPVAAKKGQKNEPAVDFDPAWKA